MFTSARDHVPPRPRRWVALAVRAGAAWCVALLGMLALVGSGGDGDVPQLTIVAQPADQSVFDGATATFTVAANNATGYQWQRLDGANWIDLAGATTATYRTVASLSLSGLRYRVVVSGNGATQNSSAATLTVLASASIATEPQDVSVAAGQDALFSVVAGGATPSYRWQVSTDNGATWTDSAGGSTATLALSAVALADNGKQYRVVVSNGGGSATSRAAALTVFAPVAIVAPPANQSAVDGSTATFSVVANNATRYQWQRLDGGGWVDVAGATAASYAFTASLAQSGLQLRVVVGGEGAGNSVTSAAANLTVTPAVVPASIVVEPQNQTVAAGGSAIFSVTAAGTSPAYRWQVSTNGGGSWSDAPNGATATLVVAAAATTDSGRQYRVIVSNSAGSATSRAALLTVLAPVAIVTQPAPQTVTDGNAATFSVVASNATGYQWQRLVGTTWTDIGGATAASHTFTASLAQNGQQWRVVVANGVGTVTSNPALLTVNPAPVPVAITAQPQSVTVIENASAAFAVTATGTAPAYRWQVSSNGGSSWTDLPGATAASYSLAAATLADDGKQFRVVVSNAANSVTSSAASLTVRAEFIVVSGGGACGSGGCGGDSGDGSGVGSGDGGSASAGPGLSAMRNVRATVVKPNGQVLGSADVGADFLVSLYPQAYTGPFIVEFADNGSGNGQYYDEALRQWLPLQGQRLRVMVPSLAHHISVNPMTEAAYQYAVQLAGSQAALTVTAMQQANATMLAQLNAKLPTAYQTNDITNFVIPIADSSGSGTLTNTWAGRYGAVMAALPIAGALFDSTLAAPAIAFTRQLAADLRDDSLFNASAPVTGAAYDSLVAAQLNAGLCTAVSIWGSPALPSQIGAQTAGPGRAGQLTLLAGSAGGAGNCDGWGSNARFDNPWRVAVDGSQNVYVADLFNKTVRKISPQGAVRTLAGSPGKAGTVDGAGLAARFTSPRSIAVDANGMVYVGDGAAIRRITPLGVVSTLAGSVTQPGYADGTGTAARLGIPEDLAVDGAGNVYVADSWSDFNAGISGSVRKVTPAGVVTTLATECASVALGAPAGVAVDSANNVYIANTGQNEICKLTASGASSVLVSSDLQEPRGLAVDGAGNVYVADAFNEVVRKVTSTGSMSTLAGGLVQRGNVDGVGSAARFRRPNGVAVDGAGNVYVADEENHTIRKITAGGTVSTLAGLGPDFGHADGTGSAAKFFGPAASVADAQGNVYIADAYNYVIRKVTPAGVASTLAGAVGERGNVDGLGNAARFGFDGPGDDTRADRRPMGLAIDGAGNLYVTDRDNDSIRRITPQGLVSTVATGVGLAQGLVIDSSGNLYVSTFFNIQRIAPGGSPSVFAGATNQTGSADGQGTSARFNGPIGLAIDAAGSIYVADTFNATVRKITSTGLVSTLAGSAGQKGTTDGSGAAARFSAPITVAVDTAGNVYVGEVGGHNVYAPPDARTVRRITPAGVVTTVVGKAGSSGNLTGALPASLGRVSSVSVVGPSQIAITADDGVFLATFP